MVDQFDGDVAFVLTESGKVEYSGGQPLMDAGGLETAVNISLWTGQGWWGNAIFDNPSLKVGSDFESKLRPNAVTLAYLRGIEEAAKNALQWMVDESIARSVKPLAVWPELNTIELIIDIEEIGGNSTTLRYKLNWEHGYLYPVTAGVL